MSVCIKTPIYAKMAGMYTRSFILLIFLLLIKAAMLTYAIMHAGIGLGPDEAQYWTWSQHLDWGYYSKPPGIAWEIAAGTSLFGNTELGVRAMPVILGFFLPILLFVLAHRSGLSEKASFWTAAAFALSPLGILASFLAITDTGMILAWTAACAYLASLLQQQKIPNFLNIGLLICIGALFKWTMFFLWIPMLACMIVVPWLRTAVSFQNLLAGIILSLAGLLPSAYWNATHDWATFRHVSSTLAGGHGAPKPGALFGGNPLDFIGSQAALVSPILFILLLMGWVYILKNRKATPAGVFFCGLLSLAVFAGGIVASLLIKMQGNWIIFAYPTAFVVIAWYAIDVLKKGKAWLGAGVVLSALLCTAVFALPAVQSQRLVSWVNLPYKASPFRHNVGWERLSGILMDAGYDPNKDFLFSDKYQTTSILSFYGPEQKRAYFLNLGGARKNQFSYWPSLADEQRGKDGIFVLVENIPQMSDPSLPEKYVKMLAPYFSHVEYSGMKPLFEANGEVTKSAFLFKGEGYNGKFPRESNLY